jgi:site-specific DNA recombinase
MKAVIYVRKSTDREDKQKLSIEWQIDACKEIAERGGFEVVEIIEDRKTAKEPWREWFSRLLNMVNHWKAKIIICWKMDRLSRNPIDWWSVSWSLQNGVIQEIHSIDGVFRTWDNVLMLGIHFGMATQYIIDLKKNVMRWMLQKLNKWWAVQKTPFWYKYNRDTWEVVIVPEEWVLVRQAFKMRSEWQSYQDISKLFELHWYKKSPSSVEFILKNTFYFWMMKFSWEFFMWKFEPLISKSAFNQVEAVARGSYLNKNKDLVQFHWMVKREEDGKPLASSVKKWKYVYYHEHARDKKKLWFGRRITQEKIFDAFEKIIERYTFTNDMKEEAVKAFLDFYGSEMEIVRTERKTLQKKKTELENDNIWLLKLRSRDEITSEEFMNAKNGNMLKIQEIESKIADLTKIDDTLMDKFCETIELFEMLFGSYKSLDDSEKGVFVRVMAIELFVTRDNMLLIKQKEPFQALFDEFFRIGGPTWDRTRDQLVMSQLL